MVQNATVFIAPQGVPGEQGLYPQKDPWQSDRVYRDRSVVKHGGAGDLWISLRRTSEEPGPDAADWEIWVDLSSATASATVAAEAARDEAVVKAAAALSAASNAASAASSAVNDRQAAQQSASDAQAQASGAVLAKTSAEAAAGAAVTKATEAATSATSASVSAALAANGTLYPTVAAGVAAVQEGGYFAVISATSSQVADIYRKTSGAGVATGKGMPSSDFVQSAKDEVETRIKPIEGSSGPAPGLASGYVLDSFAFDSEGQTVSGKSGDTFVSPQAVGGWSGFNAVDGPALAQFANGVKVDASGFAIPADDLTLQGPAIMPSASIELSTILTDPVGALISGGDMIEGPSIGLLGAYVADRVAVDARGAVISAVAAIGLLLPTTFGSLALADQIEGPAPGILDVAYEDGAPPLVQTDATGRIVAAFYDGQGGVLRYDVGDGGIIRRSETIEPGNAAAASTTVAIPAARIAIGGGKDFQIREGSVSSPLPATIVVTNAAVSAGNGTQTNLAQETIVSVSQVRRASDNAVRTLGLDYTIDMARGIVTNLTADALVIDYTGRLQRKDIVSAHPVTKALTITLGQEVNRVANLWTNAIPAGNIEIGRIFNAGTPIYSPRWRWRGGYHVARRANDASWLEMCRAAVPVTRSRLRRNLPVRIIVYGDSRGEMGGNGSRDIRSIKPNSSFADGISRDTPGYYALYDVATRTRVGVGPGQTLDFGDGYGAIHCREGYAWTLAKALEAAFPGQTFDAGPSPSGSSFRNWCIGGTASDSNQYNGLWPTRWNAVKADIIPGQTLFIISFGMNELGSTASYGNFVQMATEAKALGAEVLFISTVRPDVRWSDNIPGWRFTCRETVRAAIDTGSAWVDASELVSPENLAGLGLTEAEVCDTTLTNHEGIAIQRALGLRAASIFI